VGTATVEINSGSGNENLGSIGFGQVTPWRSMRSGSFRWTLEGGGKVLASGTSTVGNGVYDIVALAKPSGSGVELGVYKAAGAQPGTSLLRVIHAVPELGSPMVMLDSKTMASMLPYMKATPYVSVTPGVHSLSAMKPTEMKPGDPTLLSANGVHFVAGDAYTAIMVGSLGQRVRVVRVVDRGAPLTRAVSTKVAKRSDMSGSMSGNSMVVRPGDSLWSIARSLVGPSASNTEVETKLVKVWDMNAHRIGTGDPNLIFPGQRLLLP
jgi:nucleoid-associated protein YgaU